MADVQFEEQNDSYYSQRAQAQKQTVLTGLVIKLGLAKDQKGANVVFAVITVLSLVLAVWVYLYYVAGYNPFAVTQTAPTISPRQLNAPVKK